MCAQRTPLVSQGAHTALATAPPLEQLKAGADASIRRPRAAGWLASEPALLLWHRLVARLLHALRSRLCTLIIRRTF